MNNCNKLATATNRMSRINCLVSKMLSNASERSESTNSNSHLSRNNSIDRQSNQTNNQQQQNQQQQSINPNLKRNLFGIRLNHDQLKTDLNTMWKEQIEIQKVKWNFDFETLKPVNDENNDKIKWKKVNLKENNLKLSSDFVSTTIKTDELKFDLNKENNVKIDEENENSMPQFYKCQRRFKLIDDKNRLNLININNNTNNINNNNMIKEQEPVDLKSGPSMLNEKVVKPKPVKKINKLKQEVNQIITFSENRKDTLRSASTTRSTTSTQITKSESSAFKNSTKNDNLKQQSLLDMLKQRKRRINLNGKETKSTKIDNNNENIHHLRSHSANVK